MHYVRGASCPVRERQRESSPCLPPLPVLILLRASVSMVTDDLLLSLRSFISSCKTDPFTFIAYNWVPPVGGLEQKTKVIQRPSEPEVM
jgi:hypothetical protein